MILRFLLGLILLPFAIAGLVFSTYLLLLIAGAIPPT